MILEFSQDTNPKDLNKKTRMSTNVRPKIGNGEKL